MNISKIYDLLPDSFYIRLKYYHRFGKRLNLHNPTTYNEKLQWLKLYDRRPEYTIMVDKVTAKEYVKDIIGDEYIIPTLGIWDTPQSIDFDNLPDRFVIKCNHNSGTGMYICKNKTQMDKEKVVMQLQKGLMQDYYKTSREWPYKNVQRKIIAEKYMEDEETKDLRDYKFFCFDGVVKALFIATERQNEFEETKFDFFDENYIHLPIRNGHPNALVPPKKPENFELMKKLACKLSEGIPHVRVDFYEANGKVYFGELTLCHWGGFVPFEPEKWDTVFGSWLTLPKKRRR